MTEVNSSPSTLDFLAELRALGIVVALTEAGDQLKVNAPKGAVTAELGSELKARRDEVLLFLQGAASTLARNLPPIEPAERDSDFVLSPAQERVWRLHKLAPDSVAMNVPVVWRVTGPLDAGLLETALADVAAVHQVLRTRFRGTADEPVIEMAAAGDAGPELVVHDRRAQGEADALAYAEQLSAAPIDISHKGVLDAHLVQVGDDDALLVTVFHQIGFDWGAANVFARDLGEAYTSRVAGTPSALASPEVEYVDYAAWHRRVHADGLLDAPGAYWTERLGKPYSPLALPYDRARPAIDSMSGNRVSFELSSTQVDGLLAVARESGSSLYMAMLAVLHAVVTGYGRQHDGMIFSMLGSNRPELKNTLGLFANPLPLRIEGSDDGSFASLVAAAQDAAIGALGNQELPFGAVVDALRIAPGANAAGIFQLLFIYQHDPTTPLELPGATTELVTTGLHAPAFDLRVFSEPTDAGLRGWIEFKTDLFDLQTIERFRELMLRTIDAVAAAPEEPLDAVLPFTPADRVDPAAHAPANEAPHVAPSTETELMLADLWSSLLHRDEISVHDNFFAIGGHSLVAVSLFGELRAATGRDLPLATLFHSPTIAELAAVIDDDEWSLGFTSLVPIQPRGSATPIFCTAALGDEVVQFGELAALLDPDQPFYALQQGVERAERLHTDIRTLAAHYLDEVRAVQPHGPYRIAGYCFGGLVAFEMAHQLRAGGEDIEHLFLIESEIPGAVRPPAGGGSDLLPGELPTQVAHRSFTARVVRKVRKHLRYGVWASVRRRLHAAFDARGKRLPMALRDIININGDAQDAYVPTMQRYQGNAELLRAEHMFAGWTYEPDLGWDALIDGEIRTAWIPGDHEGVWKAPAVEVFAEHMASILSSSRRP